MGVILRSLVHISQNGLLPKNVSCRVNTVEIMDLDLLLQHIRGTLHLVVFKVI